MVLGFCLGASSLLAQTKSEIQNTNGVIIIEDARLPKLVEAYGETQPEGVPGYRVQIFFSAKKADALKLRTSFIEKFPDYTVMVDYAVPYFKVLAGAFRTKLQSEKLLDIVKKEFPGAFIIKSNIPISELEVQD